MNKLLGIDAAKGLVAVPPGELAAGTMVGEIRLLPFRVDALPPGWYFCNGDRYPSASPEATALLSLPAGFWADWGITQTVNGVNVPNLFSDGRGLFLRSVDGTTRAVGSIEGDAIRNLTGNLGTFYKSNATFDNSNGSGDATGGTALFWKNVAGTFGNTLTSGLSKIGNNPTLDASNQVPTASENRPLNVGMTPAIYLGPSSSSGGGSGGGTNDHAQLVNRTLPNQHTIESITGLIEALRSELPLGKIDLLPFRSIDLPFGWYFCNGDRYTLDAAPLIYNALDSLPAQYKTDWGITLSANSYNVPNLFEASGRGHFFRSANGLYQQVGAIENDGAPDIIGRAYVYANDGASYFQIGVSGAFYADASLANAVTLTGFSSISNKNRGLNFAASKSNSHYQAGLNEIRPINVGMTPAIYLETNYY